MKRDNRLCHLTIKSMLQLQVNNMLIGYVSSDILHTLLIFSFKNFID